MTAHPRRIPRLFVARDLDGPTLELDDREAHYLGNVLRLKPGDTLIAFNGRGTERHGSVAALHRRGARLELAAQLAALAESRLDLTLIQALPKADAMDLIVQKATELGVRTLLPVYSEFSVVTLDEERSARRLEHWQRIAASACEQSGRHRPPTIEAPAPLATRLATLSGTAIRVALDPEARDSLGALPQPTELAIAVGPEGGFGANDARRLDSAGFARVSFGPRILRAETAAIAACALAGALWGDLGAGVAG